MLIFTQGNGGTWGVGDLLFRVDEGPRWSAERQNYNFQVRSEGMSAIVPHAVPFVGATWDPVPTSLHLFNHKL